ncbi:predicted protein [Sparassis crispa]|uniref:Protein root UVB sensitive/RUS domain-containing protein n=1 Tax=Sparassis crispa TaxID=139825 RepID=A0A401H401_9APHY|nr:predicted protein [Sparassis crispa]GBE89158.1 predicted protein [Sparassis crispa]
MQFTITERDESGRINVAFSTTSASGKPPGEYLGVVEADKGRTNWRLFLANVFLPAGYPTSVSPDYLQYQIYNAVQAFCSSLSGLIASRAVLEGHGVGNASASATHAIFLTVIQDVFGRLTTVIAGYYLGTSLFPEAKTYRLLADIFNDAAILLDALSPHLTSVSISLRYPFVSYGSSSYLRVVSLCLSGTFRALCGVVAGGSKAALTVHFATSGNRIGDVGDLNAKDGSKETVLALLGMLGGTVVMHYVHSSGPTYLVFFMLLFCHLAANYVAVRAVVMRSFNRQRANIVWMAYRAKFAEGNKAILTPEAVARRERIFGNPATLYDASSPRLRLGFCKIGAPFASILSSHHSIRSNSGDARFRGSDGDLSVSQVHAILEVFTDERYVLWFDPNPQHTSLHLRICMKEGHTAIDHLKGWAHALELALHVVGSVPNTFDERIGAVRTSLCKVMDMFPSFLQSAQTSGWRTDEGGLLAGSARALSVKYGQDLEGEAVVGKEDRKNV